MFAGPEGSREAAEPMPNDPGDQAGFRRKFSGYFEACAKALSAGRTPQEKPLVLLAVVLADAVDFLVGEVVVFVFQERHAVVLGFLDVFFLGEVNAQVVGGAGGSGGIVDLVVTLDRLGRGGLVDFRGFVRFVLEALRVGVAHRRRLFVVGLVVGHGGA